MISPEIHVLISCHSLDDFPSDLGDEQSASLLNSFAVAFHPQLIANSKSFPQWRRADDPPLPGRGLLVFVPTNAEDWLPHGWIENARQAGATVVSGMSARDEMLAAALKIFQEEPVPVPPEVEDGSAETIEPEGQEKSEDVGVLADNLDPELVADFLSLGTCWLLIELLTRRMRQFGNIEESRFYQRLRSAAEATIAHDGDAAGTHLRACFEMLLEARERFYPVECYLLDLCLAVSDADQEKLCSELRQPVPFSLLVSHEDLSSLCQQIPDLATNLTDAVRSGRVSAIGGEDRETALPLLPLESVIYHFQHGRPEWQRLTGHSPAVWGRRKFGLTALLPQLLVKFGYKAALHVVLDDGIYPDAEYTKLRWRGVDGTLIDALSRIPLAADSAASYLRFPLRMSESMDHDQVAGLIMARWPQVTGPWFDDLRRSQKYAPCLGRFVTLDRFFEQTELPGQLSTHKPGEYFSPLLIQHVARREDHPVSRYTDHTDRRRRLDTASWFTAVANVLAGKPVDTTAWSAAETALEKIAPTAAEPSTVLADADLDLLEQTCTAGLSRILVSADPAAHGVLVLNPLSFTRRVVVTLPKGSSLPRMGGAVKAIDYDAADPESVACVVEVPGCGYCWVSLHEKQAAPVPPKLPLAERGLLRNDLFEVAINERTGGIAHLRFHNQRNKRMSQQLSFRFPRERTIRTGPEPDDTIKSQYAEMRCLGHEVVHRGTGRGELASWGEIVDQQNNEKLASFRQSVRVWRALSAVELEIELSDVKVPDGDPWNNYFASRFAWNDSTASISRGIYHSAHGFQGERFETSDFVEVASEDERLTIVPHGLPFHRKVGERMVDSLLVVAGESQRRFRFTIAVDAPYPLEAAWNATTPATVIPLAAARPHSGAIGWFFHLDARHVQITRILPTHDSSAVISPLEHFEHSTVPSDPGFALRLIETEGRSKPVKLRCFRKPTFARKRDFRGETITELNITGDTVIIEMTAFEIVEVELRFGAL